MPKADNHPDYNLYLPYWQKIRTFTKGLDDVKGYIANITNDTSPEGIARNREYKALAVYVNFAQRTRNAFLGAVFRKDPQIELPTALEFLRDNADGAGLSLEQLTKASMSNLIEVGRHGLFVDYGTQAKITQYKAETIRAWEEDEAGILIDVWLIIGKDKEKHLFIDGDGYYTVEILKDDVVIDTIQPTKADGTKFKYIPFVITGSVNNSPDVDEMPLRPIVELSRGHLQNSAENEDAIRWASVPTPYITGMTSSYFNEYYPDGIIKFGTGAVITAPQGANVGIIQANEVTMASEGMKQKEEQLIKIGARIITGDNSNITATATNIMYTSENSVLDTMVGNCEQAIEQCLEWCAEFTQGVTGEIVFKLNREYFDATMTAQDISAEILLLDRGVKAMSDVRTTLREAGNISQERTDDDIDADVEIQAGGMA